MSSATDSGLATGAQSSTTAVYISKDICSDEHSRCSSSDQIMIGPEVYSSTDSHVTARCEVADTCVHSDKVVDDVSKDGGSDKVSMDVQDLSGLETTLEYSICSDVQESRIADDCETQTTIEYCAKSTTEPVIDLEKNTVTEVRTNTPTTSDLQKPVDILSVPNSVNVDLRNNPTVHSPPTLMVV